MTKRKVPNLNDIINNKEDSEISENKLEKNNEIIKEKPVSMPIYMNRNVKTQLEELWFSERHRKISQNDLIMEGLDMVFKNRGLKSIQELNNEN